MRYVDTRMVIACDRCPTKVDEREQPHGWLIAQTALSESPAATVTYHLCPSCREDLGMFMDVDPTDPRCDICGELEEGSTLTWNGDTGNHVECEQKDRPLIERLADILYPMDEYADDQWDGADICDQIAHLLREVAPWAEHRQPKRPDDAFEAYRAERERLGL